MSPNTSNWLVSALVALVVSVVAVLTFGGSHGSPKFGGTTQSGLSTWAPANASSFVGSYGVESDAGYFDAAGAASNFLGTFALSSNTTTAGPTMLGVASTFTTSSSTIFAVKNPFAATSTLVFASVQGTQGATTTDILVATSTTPSPAVPVTATSTLGANILNLAGVTNGTKFYSVAGVTLGAGTGYTNPKGIASSVSNQEVVVGPNEYVIGFSTSTASGSGGTGASQVSVPASGTYKLLFVK